MDSLPVLLVRGEGGVPWALGQSHAIARFVARRHGLMGATPVQEAAIDCLVECVRDVRASWFKVKATRDDPGLSAAAGRSGAAQHAARQRWWASGLPDACAKLERAVAHARPPGDADAAGAGEGAPDEGAVVGAPSWLVGARISLADVAVYQLLSTPRSLVSGDCVGFFDGEAEPVRECLASCPRLAASVAAVGALPAVREWERRRPDTFS